MIFHRRQWNSASAAAIFMKKASFPMRGIYRISLPINDILVGKANSVIAFSLAGELHRQG
jgi:hypothetical protein